MSEPLTDEQLDAIEARVRAAQPGPWTRYTPHDHANLYSSNGELVAGIYDWDVGGMARVCDCGHVAQVHHGADHGPASHQGCQHGSRLHGYCGCELTSGQVADLPDPALFAADCSPVVSRGTARNGDCSALHAVGAPGLGPDATRPNSIVVITLEVGSGAGGPADWRQA